MKERGGGDALVGDTLSLAFGKRDHSLQELVCKQRKSKLRRASQDTSGAAFEESSKAFFAVDLCDGIEDAMVGLLAGAGNDLQTCFNDIGGSGEVGGRHPSQCTGQQKLEWTKRLSFTLPEQVPLDVRVGREVNSRKRDVAEQASRSALIKPLQAKFANHFDCSDETGTGEPLGFSLHLQADFDNFQRVCKNDLTGSSHAATDDLLWDRQSVPSDGAYVALAKEAAHQVIDCQLDGLFGRNTDELRCQSTIQPEQAFSGDHLSGTVCRVAIEEVADKDCALILHACLDEIDRVDDCCADSTGNRAEGKVVDRF